MIDQLNKLIDAVLACDQHGPDEMVSESIRLAEKIRNSMPSRVVRIEIETDNAAFADGECREVARILRNIADRCEYRGPICEMDEMRARDYNGNHVATVKVSE